MKKSLLLLLGIAVMFAACSSDGGEATESTESTEAVDGSDISNPATPVSDQGAVDPENAPVMTFLEENHDFGTITQGDKVEYTFKFTNTGKTDLIITNAKASCGCTVPYYPKEPIAPGEQGDLKIAYNSSGKSGVQKKSITVTANTYPKDKVLYITATIDAPEGGAGTGGGTLQKLDGPPPTN